MDRPFIVRKIQTQTLPREAVRQMAAPAPDNDVSKAVEAMRRKIARRILSGGSS